MFTSQFDIDKIRQIRYRQKSANLFKTTTAIVLCWYGFVARFVRAAILTPGLLLLVSYWLSILNQVFPFHPEILKKTPRYVSEDSKKRMMSINRKKLQVNDTSIQTFVQQKNRFRKFRSILWNFERRGICRSLLNRMEPFSWKNSPSFPLGIGIYLLHTFIDRNFYVYKLGSG